MAQILHLELGIYQTPLGGSCGIPLFEFGGGELGGLFFAPPPLVETPIVLCYIMFGICVLTETILITSTWVVCINGHM